MPIFNISTFSFPKMDFQLSQSSIPRITEHFKSLIHELKKMEQSVGDNDRLKQRQQTIYNKVKITGDLIHEINDNLDIRSVIALWRDLDAFIEKFPVSKPILTRFHQVRDPLGLLTLIGLIQLFIKRFDQCGDIRELAAFIRNEMVDRDLYSDNLKRLQKQANEVLSESGPQKIVNSKMKTPGITLACAMEMVGIPADQPGRYIDVCRQHYYIESLKQLNPGDDSSVFDELVRINISRQPYHDRWLGHEVLSIMIQKGIDSGDILPDNWMKIILNIANDPRISQRSEWWSLISRLHIEAMQGWLAGVELELFLKALSNYAKTSYDKSLQRMFPARAKFLRGLYSHKLISLSKLFIGRSPRRYLKAQFKNDQMPTFSSLNHRDLCVIYLKVGHIHMVEGSHSFSLRLYDQLPDGGQFSFTLRTKDFRSRELGIGLAEEYARQYGQDAFSVTHNPPLTWQHKVIQELNKQGVLVKPEWVLEPDDYWKYIKKFGA